MVEGNCDFVPHCGVASKGIRPRMRNRIGERNFQFREFGNIEMGNAMQHYLMLTIHAIGRQSLEQKYFLRFNSITQSI